MILGLEPLTLKFCGLNLRELTVHLHAQGEKTSIHQQIIALQRPETRTLQA